MNRMTRPAIPSHALLVRTHNPRRARSFTTGLAALDGLLPGGGFACGAVHEILSAPSAGVPLVFAALLARSAINVVGGVVAWLDPRRETYPPALADLGVPLERSYMLRGRKVADQVWSVVECCRSEGVGAVVADLPRLSKVEARRLQLAAERGGGIGLLLRPFGSAHYAAATRWVVRPTRGSPESRQWEVELVHGHGGRIGERVVIEVCRETNHVRAVEKLADRQDQAKTKRASA